MKNIILSILLSNIIFVHSDLSYTDPEVNEGPCRGYPPLAERLPYLLNPATLARFSRTSNGLITFGSEGMFRMYAEMFLGRPAKNREELNDMCVMGLLSFTFCVQIGFKNKIYTSFATQGTQLGIHSLADPILMSPGVIEIPYEDGIVWAEPDHYIFLRCIQGKVRDWKLVSVTPPSTEVKEKVLNIIESMGFNRSLALDFTDKCPPKPSVQEAMMTTLKGLGLTKKGMRREKLKKIIQQFSKKFAFY